MKNKLLITTAIALVSASPSFAETKPSLGTVDNDYTFEGTYDSYANSSDSRLGSVASVSYETTGVTVADNAKFTNNTNTVSPGGALKFLNGVTLGNNVEFTNNKATWGGGALYIKLNNGGKASENQNVVIGNNAIFSKNQALVGDGLGGAIALEQGNLSIGSGTKFTENEGNLGGAIAMWYDADRGETKSSLTLTGVEFSKNTANADAGAVGIGLNAGTANITGGKFSENHANNRGGAIFSQSDDVKISGVTFEKNYAVEGGAIALRGQEKYTADTDLAQMTVSASTFTGNYITGSRAGGAISATRNTKLTVTGSTFDGNKAEKGFGGAIYAYAPDSSSKGGILSVTDTTFSNNEAYSAGAIGAFSNTTLTDVTFDTNHAIGADGEGAGALYLGARSQTVGTNLTFTGNTSKSNGGAILTRRGDEANNSDAKLDLIGGSFSTNHADADGGAIFNTFYNDKADDWSVNIDGVEFSDNTADGNGGAIYNDGLADKTGKYANMWIKGATFTNNSATLGGAIYNSENSTIKFTGTNTFSGNNSGKNDIHNLGTIEVADNLELDGGISGTGTTTFRSGANLTVNTGTTTIENTVVNEGATLNLKLDNGFTGKYEMVTGSLDKEFTITENNLYNIVADANKAGTYEVSKKSNEELGDSVGANSNQASTIAAVTAGNSSNATFNAIAESINNGLQSDNPAEVKAALDAVTALAPEVAPIVHQTEITTVNQIVNAVNTRFTGGSVAANNKSIASGDNVFERAAVWVQGLFNKAKLDDTAKAKGFDADTYGVAFGIEKNVNENVKLGAGYAYNQSDIDGFLRETDVDTHTAILYGEYKPSNWYVNGIATYGWSNYDEKKYVGANTVKADYDVETIALQAMTGYDMLIKGFGFTPEIGLRYVHLYQDNTNDTASQKIHANKSDIFTGIIGAKFNKEWTCDNGVTFKPEVKLAATYDFANDKVSSVVNLANGASYAINGEALDRFGFEVGAGVTAEVSDNVELAIGYEGRFRENYQDHTGLVNAKYKF